MNNWKNHPTGSRWSWLVVVRIPGCPVDYSAPSWPRFPRLREAKKSHDSSALFLVLLKTYSLVLSCPVWLIRFKVFRKKKPKYCAPEMFRHLVEAGWASIIDIGVVLMQQFFNIRWRQDLHHCLLMLTNNTTGNEASVSFIVEIQTQNLLRKQNMAWTATFHQVISNCLSKIT
jgi:hypothetical protein